MNPSPDISAARSGPPPAPPANGAPRQPTFEERSRRRLFRMIAEPEAIGIPGLGFFKRSASGSPATRRPGAWLMIGFLLALAGVSASAAQTNEVTAFGPVSITLGANNGPQEVDTAIKVLFVITLLSLAPAILLLMTCFTRVVIVLSFVRTALQLQGTPANQIIVGLSLFITFFVMAPVWDGINNDAIAPYQAKQISGTEAMNRASAHVRSFMLKQARPKDIELFAAMAKLQPTTPEELPLRVVIPGFIISELRTAFQMGFLIFVPFILIDLVVATVLMSMGMMMMPPTTFSLPLKLLLFVLVDGWELVVRSLVRSFGM